MSSKLILLFFCFEAVQVVLCCDEKCQDYHRHCDDLNSDSGVDQEGLPLFNGVDQTCDSEYVKSRCPRSCAVCEACDYASADSVTDLNDLQSQLDDLESQVDQVSSSDSSSNNAGPLSQGDVPVDNDGYRIFFRSTSSEINFDDLNAFYTYGRTLGHTFLNQADSSQFRDNNYFWYHVDNNKMRYSIYDLYGDLFATVDFDFGSARPSILTALDDAYVTGSSFWTDLVANSGEIGWTTMTPSAGRFFAMIKNYGGCNNDKLWFLGSNKDGTACTWDKRWGQDLKGSTGDKVIYLYNPFKQVNYALGKLNFASHFEISYKGGDFSKASNGFERVWRYGALSGVNVLSHYEDGITDPASDRSTAFTGQANTDDLYRASNMQNQIEGADQILLVVYSREGNVAEALAFNANGDFKTWLSNNNLVSNLLWSFDAIQYFGIDGDSYWGRWFFINRNYGGCTVDAGWLVIPCLRDDGTVPCNEWDAMYADGRTEAFNQICPILYSASSASTAWYNEGGATRYASAVEIFVR